MHNTVIDPNPLTVLFGLHAFSTDLLYCNAFSVCFSVYTCILFQNIECQCEYTVDVKINKKYFDNNCVMIQNVISQNSNLWYI